MKVCIVWLVLEMNQQARQFVQIFNSLMNAGYKWSMLETIQIQTNAIFKYYGTL